MSFRIKRLVAATVSQTIGEISCRLRPMTGRRVLMYHAVGEPVVGDRNNIYSISKQLLSQHFAEISEYTNTPVASREDTAELFVSVTFDDGYKSFLTEVVPLAETYQIPIHVFISREFILQGGPIYLSESDVTSLAAHQLVTIGVHGNQHRDLTLISDDEVYSELSVARDWLEQLTGHKASTLSYPYGRVSQRVAQIAADVGFEQGFTSRYGVQSTATNHMLVPRIDVWSRDSVRTLHSKVRGAWSVLKGSRK